jgi:hypothetical protein
MSRRINVLRARDDVYSFFYEYFLPAKKVDFAKVL